MHRGREGYTDGASCMAGSWGRRSLGGVSFYNPSILSFITTILAVSSTHLRSCRFFPFVSLEWVFYGRTHRYLVANSLAFSQFVSRRN